MIDFIATVIALYVIVAGFLLPAIAAVAAYHVFTQSRNTDYNSGKHAARG